MNAKTLIAAVSLALVGTAAMATEAEQFNPAPSTLSRAGVAAVQAGKQAPSAVVVSSHEATQFADQKAPQRERAAVRAEARAAARNLKFNELYAG
ncbi:MAG TPA: hypothetical protein VJ743_17150 [Albitalea sp.]|nr:hypothetical protein [Albitalea sp.]